MASVQDRININRVALDKWTKREQLCLASAVSCSGDQNWMTVSRSLKLLCGAQHPPEWFSQKHCAVKYGELLENVETPKRKKRTNSDNSSNVVETPTDLILRRLTEERIQELKTEIREQQETYAKLYTDVVHLQTGNSNEEQIRAMWMEIEREQELDRQQKARRQLGTHEMQRNWRQGQLQQQQQQKPQVSASPINQEQDMEIDETCKPQGTSPLLSSLLKSTSPAPAAGTTTTTSTVRANAPTITNLLTGGVMSATATSPSALPTSSILTQSIPLTKPLTGPAPGDSNQTPTTTILSPSQSAPTLSMLLEKTKSPRDSPQLQQLQPSSSRQLDDEIKTESPREATTDSSTLVKTEDDNLMEDETMEDDALSPTKEEEQQLMEVFKNLMPDNIDELADILTNNNGILNTGILEEVSILEGVESLMDDNQEVDDQLEAKLNETEIRQDSKNPPPMEEDSGAKLKVAENKPTDSPSATTSESKAKDSQKEEIASQIPDEKTSIDDEEKIETISSDDSSDNVPLSTHTRDNKVNSSTIVDEESRDVPAGPPTAQKKLNDNESSPAAGTNIESTQHIADDEETVDDEDVSSPKNDQTTSSARKASLSDSSDVIIIPTDDESNDGKAEPETKKNHNISNSVVEVSSKEEESKSTEGPSKPPTRESPFPQEQTITSICLPDTDDDSSTFEAPTAAPREPREDKLNPQKQQPSQSKKNDSDTRTDDEAKQTLAVRKLRDRDRSESPLVEDDASDHSIITIRSRRRYSSTPVMDSIPNSPASSDDREFKVWKKSLMTVYNNLLTNKNASIFLRPFTEEHSPRYKLVCHRPMDLQIIKRHIESGTIRNIADLQRDVFLMCYNAIMVFRKNSSYTNMAKELMHDFVQLKEQIIDSKSEKEKSFGSSSMKVRGSARKSQRLP